MVNIVCVKTLQELVIHGVLHKQGQMASLGKQEKQKRSVSSLPQNENCQ